MSLDSFGLVRRDEKVVNKFILDLIKDPDFSNLKAEDIGNVACAMEDAYQQGKEDALKEAREKASKAIKVQTTLNGKVLAEQTLAELGAHSPEYIIPNKPYDLKPLGE